MEKLITLIFVLFLVLSGCSDPKFKDDRELLGLKGPVSTLSLQSEGGRPGETWEFDSQGRVTHRRITASAPRVFFHPWFSLENPGEETFIYKDKVLDRVERPSETEVHFFRPRDRLSESRRTGTDGTVLGLRTFERDYKGNLIAVKILDPQGRMVEFLKIDNYKTGSPAKVVWTQPNQEGTMTEIRSQLWQKNGLPGDFRVIETDHWGNWLITVDPEGLKWSREISYFSQNQE